MRAAVRAIQYHLPERTLTNADLAAEYPGWTAAKIEGKTGIKRRRIAAPDETALDLAVKAGQTLFACSSLRPADVDFVLLCTQSPDYFLPTSACMLQDRLGISTGAGALDFNLGCSGFVYGLGLAKGLIETMQARNILLFTAETYSKFIRPENRSVRTIFGDAAAVTWLQAADQAEEVLGPFVFGTDGRGWKHLVVRGGGMRAPAEPPDLHMAGTEIFNFTLAEIPVLVKTALDRAGLTTEQIDRFVFHQANAYMLDHLREKLGIASERFVVCLEQCGNTVSSTIPIALKEASDRGDIRAGHRLMLVGFGVGYSWGATVLRWTGDVGSAPR